MSTNFDQVSEVDSVAIVVTRWPNSCDVRVLALERRLLANPDAELEQSSLAPNKVRGFRP